MSICPTNNIFPSAAALPLMKEFCLCPKAKDLLESLPTNMLLHIDVNNISHAHIVPYRNLIPPKALIEIPNKEELPKSLKSLIYELLNFKNHLEESRLINAEALNGDLGMETYARQIEDLEFTNNHKVNILLSQCDPIWKIGPSELKTLELNPNKLTNAAIQEFGCHTDYYRKRWINKFKPIYCKKHPEDLVSCSAKIENLCNIEEFTALNQIKQVDCYTSRLCAKFSNLTESLKSDFKYDVKRFCPERLRMNSFSPKYQKHYDAKVKLACPHYSAETPSPSTSNSMYGTATIVAVIAIAAIALIPVVNRIHNRILR